jgi:hypothetical protein
MHANLLDTVRYLLVWHPLLIILTQTLNRFFGLQ